jgi:oligoendopeptidase F
MTPTDTAKSKAIPTRDDIEEKYTWQLTDIYKTEQAWQDDFQNAQTLIEKAKGYAGKLSGSASLLYACLEDRGNLAKATFNLLQYAHLSKDLDNRSSKYQAMSDRAAMLSSQAGAAYSFVEPELLKLSDAKLTELAGQFEKTDVYDFYIKELIRSRKHIRTEEVEELLAMSAMVARGPSAIFGLLDDADLKYPSIKDENGEEVPLTKQRFAKFLESADVRVRREASDAFYLPYKEHLNTIGASLSGSINKDLFYTKARRFDSSLHASLDSDNIPLTVYHALLDTTEANLAGLHKYVALRKRILKLKEMYPYDMFCPLFPDKDYEVPYDKAVTEVLEAVKPLGDKYQEAITNAFQSRWVDVFETAGKGGGAYSWGNYTVHPFVLMNYNDTVDNMFTLAHELGHAMHSNFSNKTQPYPKSQYSIFVAEVASTLNEGLMLHYLLGKAQDDAEKLYLINRQIDNTVGTFFNQVLYGRFELMVHDEVQKGNALSPDLMTEMWKKLTEQYYGPAMIVDDRSALKWSRIPHFYTAFYVYQYATSYAASQAIMTKFLAGDTGIIDKYLGLISAGGSDHPIELLKKCDVDMTTPGPVEANLKLFAELVDQVEALTK